MLFANVVLSWPSRIISLLLVQGSCLRTVLSAGRAVKLVRCLRTLLSAPRAVKQPRRLWTPLPARRVAKPVCCLRTLLSGTRAGPLRTCPVSLLSVQEPTADESCCRLGQLWSRGVNVSRLSATSKLSSFYVSYALLFWSTCCWLRTES